MGLHHSKHIASIKQWFIIVTQNSLGKEAIGFDFKSQTLLLCLDMFVKV